MGQLCVRWPKIVGKGRFFKAHAPTCVTRSDTDGPAWVLSPVVPGPFVAGKAMYSAVVAEGPRCGGQMGAADRRPHHAHAPEERGGR